MCRNIKTLVNCELPVTFEYSEAAVVKLVRQLIGSSKPSKVNRAVFKDVVQSVRQIILGFCGVIFALGASVAHGLEPGAYIVSANKLNVRLSPRPQAQVLMQLKRGEFVTVYQAAGDWARISEYYDGAQEGFDGMVAHWVSSEFLAVPGEVPKTTSRTVNARDLSLEAVIRQSDAFEKHSDVLLMASKRLVDSGTCTLSDFQATRGWSLDAARQPATFFTYCSPGGNRKSVFLDPITGTVFH